ncbi:MAG: hypothetical protein GXY08_02195 [Ruminococcus sp.]|nr:hypothetical protein [Ruminococcus sp.]
MKSNRLAAIIAAAVMSASLAACGGKKSSGDSSSGGETSTADVTAQTEETSAEVTTSEKETTVTTTAEKTSETTTEGTTKPADEKNDEGGYADSTALAQDFYKAYLGHNAEAVYAMFDPEEMEKYSTMIKDELDGKDPAVLFSKKAIVDAIDKSMTSVGEIMDAYSDSGQDTWTVEVTADDLEAVEQDQLDDFNADLGTSYSEAKVINYVFYKDDSNGQSFTGNASAFLKKNGKWYLSYSSLMQSELINHLDL